MTVRELFDIIKGKIDAGELRYDSNILIDTGTYDSPHISDLQITSLSFNAGHDYRLKYYVKELAYLNKKLKNKNLDDYERSSLEWKRKSINSALEKFANEWNDGIILT